MIPVGRTDDPAERQADALAERALAVAGTYSIRRSAGSAPEGLQVDPAALARARRGGTDLDPTVRRSLEPGLGSSLDHVRVHTGGEAASMAAQMGAAAFTHGNDIYFGAGQYRPGTADGDHLIAHEAAHTVQQSAGSTGVHRFPATALSSPQPWAQLTGSVFRPGEGLSGGVYILSPKTPGPVSKVVVKPIWAANAAGVQESGEQLVVADTLIREVFGVAAPQSRSVNKGSAEFAELLQVCLPHQPAKPTDEDAPGFDSWASIADASAFVVMSEVPNSKSFAGMVDKAGSGDQQATLDLLRLMFDPGILFDLGKLGVADLLIGNRDRLMFGAANLGNLMVSVQNGSGKLFAIDSAVFLPKAVPPSSLIKNGNTIDSMQAKSTSELDKDANAHFQRFVDAVKFIIGSKQNGPAVSAQIDQLMNANKQTYAKHYKAGWDAAMIDVMMLWVTLGDGAPKDSTDRGNSMTHHDTLMSNAGYMTDRFLGDDHKKAAENHAGELVKGFVGGIDWGVLVPPTGDALGPDVLRPLPTSVLKAADTMQAPSQPDPPKLKNMINKGNLVEIIPGVRAQLDQVPYQLVRSHAEIDNALSMTKTKKTGFLGRNKKEVANKHNEASHFALQTIATAVGAGRAADAVVKASRLGKEIASWTFPLNGEAKTLAAQAADKLDVTVQGQAALVKAYGQTLAQAKTGLAALKSHPSKPKLVALTDLAVDTVTNRFDLFDEIKQMNLKQKVQSLSV